MGFFDEHGVYVAQEMPPLPVSPSFIHVLAPSPDEDASCAIPASVAVPNPWTVRPPEGQAVYKTDEREESEMASIFENHEQIFRNAVLNPFQKSESPATVAPSGSDEWDSVLFSQSDVPLQKNPESETVATAAAALRKNADEGFSRERAKEIAEAVFAIDTRGETEDDEKYFERVNKVLAASGHSQIEF